MNHKTIYRSTYVDQATRGGLYQQLGCQKQRKKRYASGRDRRGVRLWAEDPLAKDLPILKQEFNVGHWEGDTLIKAHHKQAVITLVEHKSGYALIAKVSNKTSDLVSHVIITILNYVTPLVRTLSLESSKIN